MGIVTFVSDDLSNKDWDYRDVFLDRGAGCVISVVFNNLGIQLGADKLKALEDSGYEVAAHSVSHASLDQLPYPQLRYEVQECRRECLKLGFDCQNMALPFGNYNDIVLDTCRRFYRGTRSSDIGHNASPYDTANLKTYWLDGGADIAVYKTQVDVCAETDTWLILSFHTNSASRAFMDDVVGEMIDYCQAKADIRIMTMIAAQDALGIPAAPPIGEPYRPPTVLNRLMYGKKRVTAMYYGSSKIKYDAGGVDETLYALPNGIADTKDGNSITRNVGHLVLSGTENWVQYSQMNSSGRFSFRLPLDIILNGQSDTDVNVLSRDSPLEPLSYAEAFADKTTVCITQYDISGVPNVIIRLQSGMFSPTNVTGFKSWLLNNPQHILYALKTPYVETT